MARSCPRTPPQRREPHRVAACDRSGWSSTPPTKSTTSSRLAGRCWHRNSSTSSRSTPHRSATGRISPLWLQQSIIAVAARPRRSRRWRSALAPAASPRCSSVGRQATACAAASTRSTECSMPQTLPHPMQRARPSSPEPIASWRRPTMRSTATQSGDSSPPRPSSSTSRATKSLPCCLCHSPSSSNTLQDAVRSTISSWSCTTRILSQRRRPPPGHSWVMWDLAPIAWLIDSTWVPTHRTAGATLDPGHRWRSAEGSLTEAFRVDNDPLSGCAV